MWKHKKLGFIVTNVHFINGWASFNSNGIDDFMEEVKLLDTYEVDYEMFKELTNV